ncbi:ATP-dependent RecD-like DNA helicase [termite gut metagenome]|uniref:ATP-dependent RecD-like DNA helicase n=1 Tax=termite gut metagenome TaxID=433724 RepID=A0A5J4S4C6_9ZZZZ
MAYEDIFNSDAIELIVRFGDHTRENFDKVKNQYSFEHIKNLIDNKECTCYFAKQTDSEHKIVIPLNDLGGQFEIIATWHISNTYEIKVNKQKKTKYKNKIELPEKQYSIEQSCFIRFIGIDERYNDYRALEDLEQLKKRVDNLEIAPKTLIENQRDIWTKYIEAQELLIKKLQEPFLCAGQYQLSEIKNAKGDIARFKFKVDLVADKNNEYRVFEEELKKNLDVDETFNVDGTTFLTMDEIFRGLDLIIQKRFSETFERERKIGCILKIRPFSLVQKIQSNITQAKIRKEDERRCLRVSDLSGNLSLIAPVLAQYGFKLSDIEVDFHITNVENLYHSPLNQKYSITFGKRFQKKDEEKELLFPEPINENTFRITKQITPELDLETDKLLFFNSLSRIYGKDNIEISQSYIYKPVNEEVKFFESDFTNEYWTNIKRELYLSDFDVTIRESDKSLYFEFIDRDDLVEKFEILNGLNKFDTVKSPLDDDFRFKVKTNLIAKKTAKQIFIEKIEKLRGVEFVYNQAEKDSKRSDYIFIGKLSANESTINQLVFNIPYFYPDEKKLAKKFLELINKKTEIKAVQANLRGDEAKTKWLREAMDKLKEENQQSNKPNSKPVNPKIRNFIFDSSKAEPAHKFDFTPIEETEEYKTFSKHEILKLNDSQRKSVLRALYSNDLCLLQGPPGTGKTTVIAELIWQHIRQSQTTRLLLTSETNLAVDNALEKLMNTKNATPELARYISLIKPIRFGKAAKFEEEGKKYSIERIQKWIDEEYVKEVEYENEQLGLEGGADDMEEEAASENPNFNAIQQWMIRIADRADSTNPKYENVLKDWVIELSQPAKETKHYFKNKYFKYVNVIGSTCSSTGSPAFSRDYQSTFNPNYTKEAFKKVNEILFLIDKKPNSWKISSLIDELGLEVDNFTKNNFKILKLALNNYLSIRFDTVIMDEASKATPPDLLLPLCFGKKSIVIGDHRQLPPLLNEKDFKEVLLDLGDAKAKQLAEEIDREFVETSQFKRLILNPKVSHTIKSTFNIQYRMHPHINDVIKQFYLDDECGGLLCGLDKEQVDSPDLKNPQSRYHGFFHDGFINDKTHTIWVNVDAPEIKDGTSRVNETEVEVVKTVLTYLKHSQGFDEYMKFWDGIRDEEKRKQEKEVGIISFYGKQVSKLRNVRITAKQLDIPLRLNTVDKFQGMERNIIIVSTVRSNKMDKGNNRIENNEDIGFAKAPERLNVALSRARRLLIIVGNKDFFYKFTDKDGNPLYKNAIDEIENNGRIIDYKTLTQYSKK